jgi:hypothetical protein
MTSPQWDWTVLLAISIAVCVAFLVQPEGNVQEAHRLCAGQPNQLFESMAACTVNQPVSCSCVRPRNPWVIAYWLVFLPGVGIAAALLLRARGAVSLAGAVAVGGFCGFLAISLGEGLEPDAWAAVPLVIAADIAITLAAFGLARLARHLVVTRQPAT